MEGAPGATANRPALEEIKRRSSIAGGRLLHVNQVQSQSTKSFHFYFLTSCYTNQLHCVLQRTGHVDSTDLSVFYREPVTWILVICLSVLQRAGHVDSSDLSVFYEELPR